MQSPAQRLAYLPQAERDEIFNALSDEEKAMLDYDWNFWARPNQLPLKTKWFIWLIRSGRGGGKTRTAAEWTIERVKNGYKRIALIGQTKADARDTMIEIEESSILKISPPWFMPIYEPSKRRLSWPNGAVATVYSGDEPDQLRGPQFDSAWIDELCKFKYPAETWDNLMMGLRLSDDPKVVITSTPRPIPILKKIMARADCIDTVYSSYDNFANLSEVFINNLKETYEGTRLGLQEIHGKILEDNPDALWNIKQIESNRVSKHPDLKRIVVGVDPATTSKKKSAETGIIAVAKGTDNHYYVLDDKSCKKSPDGWAKEALAAYNVLKADRIVGEQNQGGDMVENTLRTIDPDVSYKSVHASKGKAIRAEPVAALYEQGKVHHVGSFSDLETQMIDWSPLEDTYSPDRVDALVWAITELMGKSYYSGNVSLAGNDEFHRQSPNSL